MTAFKFDEELSRKIEALYVTPDVVAQRRQVLQALKLVPGEQVLDIGSGPGLWPMTWRSRLDLGGVFAASI